MSCKKPELYHSYLLGYSFWIDEDNIFMSAPTFKDDTVDMENAIAVSDWDSFNELNKDHLSHLFGQVLTMCVYKRELLRIDYYSDLFNSKSKVTCS